MTKAILTRACDTERHHLCCRVIEASNPWRRRMMRNHDRYECACSCHTQDVTDPNYGRTA